MLESEIFSNKKYWPESLVMYYRIWDIFQADKMKIKTVSRLNRLPTMQYITLIVLPLLDCFSNEDMKKVMYLGINKIMEVIENKYKQNVPSMFYVISDYWVCSAKLIHLEFLIGFKCMDV